METHASIFISKFTLAFGDFKNGYIEINYNNKKENISYPQNTPLSLIFPPKFLKDKQLITINAKKKTGNKIKTVAHGELVLYKNNLIDGKGIVEKYITMVQIDSKIDSIKINKDNMGKIYVKISLEEPYEEWKKKFSNRAGSSLIYKKTIENKELKKYKKINFDDNLSLLTITKIERDTNDIKNINLEQFISLDELKKLKKKFENEYQNILPHDFTNLKMFNKNLYEQYTQLDEKYKNILQNIIKENNDIKSKAKQTYEKYKQNKKNLYRLRIEFKLKKQNLNKEINSNKDDKNDLIESIDKLNNEQKYVYNQIFGEKNEENENNNIIEDKKNDINIMTELLNKLYSLGYNIDDEMNEQEKKILNSIINKNENKENKNNKEIKEALILEKENEEDNKNEINDERNDSKENNKDEKEIENGIVKDDHLSEQIVALIERDVNDLYSRKLIKKMKIDQIDSITYSFSTDEKKMIISFKIENNNLICSNGQTFAVWVISNFNS